MTEPAATRTPPPGGGKLLSRLGMTFLVLLLGLALAGGAHVVRGEWLSYRAEAIFANPDRRDNPARLKALADVQDACGDRCSVRVWLAASAIRAQAAETEPSPVARRVLLLHALADARAAEAREPANGDATLQRAYLTLILAASPTAPEVLQALRDSYRTAPFSLRGGWRLVHAGRFWASLDKPLRTAVLDEAAWLVEIKPRLRPQVEAAFTDPAGQFALALRLDCSGHCARTRPTGAPAP